jgi:hypothetical protein
MSAFSRSGSTGLRFERIFDDPPIPPRPLSWQPSHYHRYDSAPLETGFHYWHRGRILARWNIPIESSAVLKNVASVWHLMKSRSDQVEARLGRDPALFGLTVTIRAPQRSYLSPPALLKSLFDGILSALHSHNGQEVDVVSERLARKLNLPQGEVAGDLMSAEMQVLGARRLVWPFGGFIQWNPADDRCIAGELLLQHSDDPHGALAGELFEVVRSAATAPQAPSPPAIA